MDGTVIENARNYLDTKKKHPAPLFDEKAGPVKGEKYTIHSRTLDPKKLGFVVYGDLQFQFLKTCHEPIDSFYKLGPAYVTLPNGPTTCLVYSSTYIIPTSQWSKP